MGGLSRPRAKETLKRGFSYRLSGWKEPALASLKPLFAFWYVFLASRSRGAMWTWNELLSLTTESYFLIWKPSGQRAISDHVHGA